MSNVTKKKLLPEQSEELLRALEGRFEKNMNRHKGLEWAKVQAKLEADTDKLWSLSEMERTRDLPGSLVLFLPLKNHCPSRLFRLPRGFPAREFALAGYPVHVANSQSARFSFDAPQ